MSAVWAHFDISKKDTRKAICKACNAEISRGGTSKKTFSTSGLIHHIKSKHPDRHAEYEAQKRQDNWFMESMPRRGNRSEAAKRRWRHQTDPQLKTLPSGPPARTGNLGNPAQSSIKKFTQMKKVVVPEHAQKTIKMKLQEIHHTLFAVASNSSPSSSTSSRPQKPLENGTHTEDAQKVSESDKKSDLAWQLLSGELTPVDFDGASLDNVSAEEKSTKSSLSCAFSSPDAGLECDPEVKEGFLFHSEADEGQGEWDEVKDRTKEKMNVDGTKDEKKDAEVIQSSKAADGPGNSSPTSKKRTFSPEGEKDGRIDVEVKDGKRARVESMEFELKITANAGSRVKLEKVVQQLVEDRLQVLQLTVFDRTIMELKERVEKIDTVTKQQNALQHICTLQAKISRLAKKFGAANQASEYSKRENIKCLQTTAKAIATPQTTSRIQRTALDPKQPSAAATSSTATPAQPKPLSSLTTASSSALAAPAPILQILSTTTGSTSSFTTSSLTGQAGALQLQTRPNTGVMTASMATSGSQSVSTQPLLVPLAMANGQAGATTGGVGVIPVSSLATVNDLNKAKTTTAPTNIIEQKSARSLLSTSPSSSSTASQVSSGRSLYQGGTGRVSPSSAAISVPTARAPTQCASVVGSAAAGVSSASEKASQTDCQAFNSTPAKSLSQSAHSKSSFIDLTEEDDDVQVTCVQKATAPSLATSSQRPSEPSPLISSTSTVGLFAVQHQPSVDSPSKSRPDSSSSAPLPPLPLAPTPPAGLPPEAAHTSLPQQPQLELAQVQNQNSIVLSWCVPEMDSNCAAVDSYHLYSYHQDHQGSAAASSQSLWKKIGEVKALPLPMACTLTQFVSSSTYYFAVRAKDVYGRFGPFCEPQCTDVINPPSAGSSGAG